MAVTTPFNVTILDPDLYIQQRQCLPVTSHSIFEPSSNRFDPNGLFSEVIFGQVGSRDRLIRRGYMDLRTKIISPHLFKQLMALKGFYQDVCAAKTYAVYDKELKDLVRVPKDDPQGETGYSYFLRVLPKIVFPESGSSKRHNRIELLKKYKDLLLMTRFIVLPAGVRDIKEKDDRLQIEEINKYYTSLLSLTQALPEGLSEDPVYDGLRYQIQMKVQMIYSYILDLLDDKGGFLQSKYAARHVVYSNRNVITAAPMTRSPSPDAPNNFNCDQVMIPLFQTMKGAVPLIINKMKSLFFDQIFVSQTAQVPLINSKTLKITYEEISPSTLRKFSTSEGIADIIDEFRDANIHFKPVTVPTLKPEKDTDFYLYMVYDTGDTIYTFRDVDDFKHAYSRESSYTTQGISNLDRLTALGITPEQCIIMGSSALFAFGMDHYNQDLDLIVEPSLFEKIKNDDENFDRTDYGCYRSVEFGIDVYNEVDGILINHLPELKTVTFDQFKKENTIKVDGYNFISPKQLLYVYQKSDRPKDIDKIKFLKSIVFDPVCVHPLTYVEMCYIATEVAMMKCMCTMTRHPVTNLQGIQVFRPHLTSTNIGRVVTYKSVSGTSEGILPEYPVLHGIKVKNTMSPHPSSLAQYDGDFDGYGD